MSNLSRRFQQPTPKKPIIVKAAAKPPEKTVVARGRGRPRSDKEQVTIRLSAAVLAHYKGFGKGWQSRLNADLLKLNRI